MKIELGGYTDIAYHATGGTNFNDATRAVKTITFTGQPSDSETVTVDGHVFTFSDDSSVLAFEAPPRSFTGRYPGGHTRTIRIGDTVADTVENLLVSIKFCPPVNEKALVARGATNQIINITYRKCGTDGNAYAVSSGSGSAAVTTSAATDAGDARYPIARAFVMEDASATVELAVPKSIRGDGKASLEGGVCTEKKPSTIKATATITLDPTNDADGEKVDLDDDTGTTHTFTLDNGTDATINNIVGIQSLGTTGGDAAAWSARVTATINDATSDAVGKMTATDNGDGTVTVTQDAGGADGNQAGNTDDLSGGSVTAFTGGSDATIKMYCNQGEIYPVVTCGSNKAVTLLR